MRLECSPKQRDERAAGTVSKQRQADDHVREVMPLHDRQHAHQQYLVTDGRGGNEKGCDEKAPHGGMTLPYRLPVSGTKRTGAT